MSRNLQGSQKGPGNSAAGPRNLCFVRKRIGLGAARSVASLGSCNGDAYDRTNADDNQR